MASCLLFHGPGARTAALQKAREIGRLIVPPIGDDGLKVEESRAAVLHLLDTPLHAGLGVLVIGPMDEANPRAPDPLLKSIEEFNGDVVQPILWAKDLGGVTATIRSRCLDFWCPTGDPQVADDDETPGAAYKLIEGVRAGDASVLPEAIKGIKGKDIQRLLDALAEILVNDLDDEKNRRIWGELRKVTRWHNTRSVEVLAALMRAL